ncbi:MULTISPECIES: hypothetical protein [Haloferax]|uniref:Uncharacterized protein n=2 Tax=Haloferax TaxID=2251 RepID=A0A6G1YZ56_9EURY|nr:MULTISPECIES: hypothetical protein [Haloferax]KAB1186933.1 hypothetical protein Hfx1149_02370 [Haloferax sp. CBA1149]MRW79562.1 hypothetical protein [Haloferax marinisediminis]
MSRIPAGRVSVLVVTLIVLFSGITPSGVVADNGGPSTLDDLDSASLCPASYPSGQGSWSLIASSSWTDSTTLPNGLQINTCRYSERGQEPIAGGEGYITFTVRWVDAENVLRGTDICEVPDSDPYLRSTDRAVQVSWSGWYNQTYDPGAVADADEWLEKLAQGMIGPDDAAARAFGQQLLETVEPHAAPCTDEPASPPSVELTNTPRETGREMAFGGYVFAYDEQNQYRDLEEVQVILHVTEGAKVRSFVTHTDDTGIYAIRVSNVSPQASYQLEVRFEDRDEMFKLYRRGEPTLLPVGYTTAPLSVEAAELGGLVLTHVIFQTDMADSEPVHLLADGSTSRLAATDGTQVYQTALVYVHAQTALAYGRDRLNVDFDETLPIWLEDGPGNSSFTPDPANEQILIRAPPAAERRQTVYHEIGHYVNYRSGMGKTDNMGHRPASQNHQGVRNPDSTDSFAEGWAGFYTALVEGHPSNPTGSAYYALSGPSDLQDNTHEWWLEDPDERLPNEEVMVASLLWDVMDDDTARPAAFARREPGDDVAWGLSRLWEAMGDQEDLTTVHDLYVVLKEEDGEPLPGPTDPPTDLDRLFILHGFYSENNGVPGWQQGEPIGFADRSNSIVDPTAPWDGDTPPPGIRETPPSFAGPWLDVTIEDEAGRTLPFDHLHMTVVREDAASRYELTPDADTGYFPLAVPPDAEAVTVQARLPGYGIDTYKLTQQEYAEISEVAGADTVVSVTLTLPSEQVTSLPWVNAERESTGTVSLTWPQPDAGSTVVVVRQAVRPPQTPNDGVLLYEGSETGIVDHEPAPVLGTYYAVFVVAPDGGVSQPTVASSQAPPLSRSQVVDTLTNEQQRQQPEPTPSATASPSASDETEGLDSLLLGLLGVGVGVLVVAAFAVGYLLRGRGHDDKK